MINSNKTIDHKVFQKVIYLCLALLICSNILAQAPPKNFKNPILPGFYPDPSICRVGDNYYLVNSSFEWFPGLPIHRSKDLVNWEKIGHGLHRTDQIEYMDGLDDSNGIFAPTIRYHEGKFYIITTMVGQKGNFIISASKPEGPWSNPIWIEDAPGIDPSLFWDEDGRCYYTGAGVIDGSQNEWPGKYGIWMQEIDVEKGILIGEKKQLTFGHAQNARWAEGPHLYKIKDEYVLMIGEGGTGEYHAVTVFNSSNLWGPYIPNHANPVMTHRHLGNSYPIGQTGHADLVQTQHGDWWSVMLAKRKIQGYITLARETFLSKLEMTDQESGITPIFNPGYGLLQESQERPNLPWSPVAMIKERDDFDADVLGLEWNFLRTPRSQWYQIIQGNLELQLRPETISELVNPSFIGKRTRFFNYQITAELSFKTNKENEKAGLVIYRRHGNHYQLLRTKDGLVLIKTLQKENRGEITPEIVAHVPYKGKSVVLKAKVQALKVQFYYGADEHSLEPIGDEQDYTIVSDEVTLKFNGVYAGIYGTSSGKESKAIAQFGYFEMKEIDE